MRLIEVHATVMALCLTVAIYCIVSMGLVPSFFWLFCAIPWLYRAQVLRQKHLSQHIGSGIACVCLVWCVSVLWRDGQTSATQTACYGILGILTARLVTRRTPAHDWHALVLSMLAMFVAAIVRMTPMYALALTAYCVLLTFAAMTRQFLHAMALQAYRTNDWQPFFQAIQRRDIVSWRFIAGTHLVSLALFVLTGIFFLLFPRNMAWVPLDWGMQRSVHFPPNISLFTPPRAANDDHDVIARIYGLNYGHYIQGLYLRGHVYETATRVGFIATPEKKLLPEKWQQVAQIPSEPWLTYDVDMLPLDDQYLLSLGYTKHAEPVFEDVQVSDSGIILQGSGEILSRSPFHRWFRYRLIGQQMGAPAKRIRGTHKSALAPYPEAFVQQYMALPEALDARIAILSLSVVNPEDSVADKVKKVRQYLLKHYRYRLYQAQKEHRDPLAHFLFEDKQGHCEYFATAFAIMLRSLQIPSRVVGGLQGGIWNEVDQSVAFTAGNAHAWIEWFDPTQQGWVADDATPPTPAETLQGLSAWFKYGQAIWDEKVLGFDLQAQWRVLQRLPASWRHLALSKRITEHMQKFWHPGLIWGVVWGLAGVLIASFFWRRTSIGASSLSEVLRVRRLIEKTLAHIGQKPLSRTTSFDEAFLQLKDRLAPDNREMLASILAVYAKWRFGQDAIASAQIRHTCRQLEWLLQQHHGQ